MQKIGPHGDGKSTVATTDGRSRKKKIQISTEIIQHLLTNFDIRVNESI